MEVQDPRGPGGVRGKAPAVAALAVFALLATARAAGLVSLYDHAIQYLGVAPFRFPFLDADMVLSGLRCARRGLDVYVVNPCDALGRIYDYSPAWLALAGTGLGSASLVAVGLAVDLAFLACLLLLPAGRTGRDVAMIVAGCLSTATVFALERANIDVVVLSLALVAAWLVRRAPAFRALGYGLAFLAGLLKYYPMALMLLAVRERARVIAAVAAATALGLAAFVAVDGHDLRRALALIPTGSYFGDMFGARTLPMGLAALIGHGLTRFDARVLEAVLVLAMVGIGGRIGTGREWQAGLSSLTGAERSCLMVGAVLVLGCFLTAQNIGYRAIDLIPALPALAALRRLERRREGPGTTLVRLGPFLLVLLLWSDGWRFWLREALKPLAMPGLAGSINLLAWLAREAAWWNVATLLFACLCGLVLARLQGRPYASVSRKNWSASSS